MKIFCVSAPNICRISCHPSDISHLLRWSFDEGSSHFIKIFTLTCVYISIVCFTLYTKTRACQLKARLNPHPQHAQGALKCVTTPEPDLWSSNGIPSSKAKKNKNQKKPPQNLL